LLPKIIVKNVTASRIKREEAIFEIASLRSQPLRRISSLRIREARNDKGGLCHRGRHGLPHVIANAVKQSLFITVFVKAKAAEAIS